MLAIYSGTTITGPTALTSNDDFNGSTQSKMTFAVTSGTNYRIAVDGCGNATGSIGLQWTIAAPANNNFAERPGADRAVLAQRRDDGEVDRRAGRAGLPRWRDRRQLGVVQWTPAPAHRLACACATSRLGWPPGSAVYTGAASEG